MSTLDVIAVIDERPISKLQVRVAVLCFCVLVVDGFDAQAIGYVAPSLARSMHLQPAQMGPVFTVGIVGMVLGSLLFGLFADRFGRKKGLLTSMALFGILTVAKGWAGSVDMLLTLQFLAGLGLGGAYPNAIALISEYAPSRSRNTVVTMSACGYLFGSSMGGFLAAVLIPLYGWPAVFQFGGALPILLAILAAAALPDSIRYLVLQGGASDRVAQLLHRIAPALAIPPNTTFLIPEMRTGGSRVAALFRDGRGPTTVLTWVTQFMNLMVAFFVFSWLPLLFKSAGIADQRAMLAATALPIGAMIGTLVWGRIIDRLPGPPVLACAALVYALFLSQVGSSTSSYALMVALVFLAGFGSGSQSAFNSYVATLYPTTIRSTGVGWAIGVGRVGSMLGPLLGGAMIAAQWSLPTMFYAAAMPALIAAAALFGMGRLRIPDAAVSAEMVAQRES
jgi:AAHS family 4-hydroxybenzoate transporter-like MFS transporter